jgi:hypothetical protein
MKTLSNPSISFQKLIDELEFIDKPSLLNHPIEMD